MATSQKSPPKKLTNGVLRKHVAAVHTSGELGLVERKIVNILLLNAYDKLLTSSRHTIPVRYLSHMLGWESSKNLDNLKQALARLQTTRVEFNLMHDGQEVWQSMTLLAYAQITGSLNNGECTYGYVEELAAKLHDPAIFATINVGVQRGFKGGYSLTLYENAVRFKNVRSTGWWSLEKFRQLMGANAPMYDDFKRLSSFVIKKAVEEINRISDIKLTVEYQRQARHVAAVRFLIEENPQSALFAPKPLDEDGMALIRQDATFKKLIEHGFAERLALAYMKQDPEQARLAVEETEKRDKKGLIKTSPAGYIKKLFEEKADLGGTAYQARKTAEQAIVDNEKKTAAAKAKYEALRIDFRDKTVREIVKNLTSAELADYPSRFLASEEGRGKTGNFDLRTGKFTDTMTNALFKPWLRREVTPVFDEAAFDEFVRGNGIDPAVLRAAQ